jgi:hypothetical protein
MKGIAGLFTRARTPIRPQFAPALKRFVPSQAVSTLVTVSLRLTKVLSIKIKGLEIVPNNAAMRAYPRDYLGWRLGAAGLPTNISTGFVEKNRSPFPSAFLPRNLMRINRG